MVRGTLRRAVPALALLVLIAAACGGTSTTTTKTTPRVTNGVAVKLADYTFEVGGPIAPGLASVKLENTGQEPHEMAFAPMKDGVTVQQVFDAYSKGPAEAEKLLTGPPDRTPFFLSPGKKTEVITDIFQAGNYALLCFIPAPDGQPHAAKGMIGTLEVKGATPAPVDITSNGDVVMTEYRFELPTKFSSGKGTFKLSNTGMEPHSASLIEVAAGKTREDVVAYFTSLESDQSPPPGEPPAFFAGGSTTVRPGETMYLVLDLKPATKYLLVCNETTADDKDHIDLGMMVEFTTT
jgi:uncharacterized cupredoxin-like copper-binding protein